MKEINRIDHIGIRITDLDASRRFYEQLGFEFLIGPIGPEPVAIMEHPSGVNINLIINANTDTGNNVLMDIEEKHPGYTHFALGVTNIKAVMNTIKEASRRCWKIWKTKPWSRRDV